MSALVRDTVVGVREMGIRESSESPGAAVLVPCLAEVLCVALSIRNGWDEGT